MLRRCRARRRSGGGGAVELFCDLGQNGTGVGFDGSTRYADHVVQGKLTLLGRARVAAVDGVVDSVAAREVLAFVDCGSQVGADCAGGLDEVNVDLGAFGQRVGVVAILGSDEAFAGLVVEGSVIRKAALLGAKHGNAEGLLGVAKGVGVPDRAEVCVPLSP